MDRTRDEITSSPLNPAAYPFISVASSRPSFHHRHQPPMPVREMYAYSGYALPPQYQQPPPPEMRSYPQYAYQGQPHYSAPPVYLESPFSYQVSPIQQDYHQPPAMAQRGYWSGEYQPQPPFPRGPRRLTDLHDAGAMRTRSSTMDQAPMNHGRSNPRRGWQDTGFHRTEYPHASAGYEGYIINNNMETRPDYVFSTYLDSPPRYRPTIYLPGMPRSRTAYAMGEGQRQNTRAAHNSYGSFQPTGARPAYVEHPNANNFSFKPGNAQPVAPRPMAANLSFAPPPSQAHSTAPQPPRGEAFVSTITLPPRPTAESLSFGRKPSSSPIETWIYEGAPHTRRGQPVHLLRPRTNPHAAIDNAVAAGIVVPCGDDVESGNLREQTLTTEMVESQAKATTAWARGEVTYMDGLRFAGVLGRVQEAAASEAEERALEQGEEEGGDGEEKKVRAWDIKGWRVAGEGERRERMVSEDEGDGPEL